MDDILDDSAALEATLDRVPGAIHPVMVQGSIVLHSLLHEGLDGGAQIYHLKESSDNDANL